ncbi:MAG: phenylacetic acid degradation protein PaaN [Rhodospirillales bacterium]
MAELFERHRETLEAALKAAETRDYWSAYPEVPSTKIYGETAAADGEAAFKARLGRPFELPGHPAEGEPLGAEVSPYGLALEVGYPTAAPETLIAAAAAAGKAWAAAGIETRIGVCLEILARLNRRSFELAQAVSHTSGQSFVMAFQAGGPHAQDRGLEAVVYAYRAMTQTPASARWTKPQGKQPPIVLEKHYRVIPRGIALTIGCNTFPTWNAYPGLFASLATGNAVIVKPHPAAILPLAITLEIARGVLSEAGFDPNLLLLAADAPGREITKDLATRPEIKIIDYTGSNAFAQWLRDHACQAELYSEEAGVNSVVVTGCDDFKGLCANIAFSLSLYSGQMCTAPQNVFIPKEGIESDRGHLSFDDVAEGIKAAVDKLLGDPARAAGICGAIANPATLERLEAAAGDGEVLRASTAIEGQAGARTATPLLLKVEADKSEAYAEERFGPIAFLVASESASAAIARAAGLATEKGAITAAVYAVDPALLAEAEEAFAQAGVSLSCNLTGNIFVNQSAAFSDYHVTGANPAGNACLTDAAFVANRFRIAAVRRPLAA